MTYPVTGLKQHAAEGQNYPVPFSFYDQNGDGDQVLPDAGSVTWTLLDLSGTVIDTGTVTSALEMLILLEGEQLAVSGTPCKYATNHGTSCDRKGALIPLYGRRLLVKGTATTEINGTVVSNVNVGLEFSFFIEGLIGI